MRKSLFFILLATGSVPALAAPDSDGNNGRRSQNTERSERDDGEKAARPQRAERVSRAAASPQDAPIARVQRTQRSEQPDAARTERRQRASGDNNQNVSRHSGQGSREYSRRRQVTTDSSSRYSGQYSGQYSGDRSGTNWRDRTRTTQTINAPSTGTNRLSNWNDRDGDRDGRRRWDGDRDGRRWSGDWRRDNRYDWRRHRSRYSSLFRLGRYYDPYRYGYQRFSIGLTLGSGYYNNSNYWLNDPWQYRLPPAYGPYRWIRYYDDALLVNIYSGEVVDVIHGFFW